MNTLQLYISKSATNYLQLAEINSTDEGRKAATDVKAAVSLVDYPATEKNIFLVVANVSGGYAIHIVRTIPPRRGNYLDATIFVGGDLDIMADDLRDVIDKVSATILASSVTEADMAALRKLFAYEYDKLDKTPRVKPSRGRDFAYLTYNDSNAFDSILAEGLYRPEWSAYRAVVILPDDIAAVPGSMTDLAAPAEEATDAETDTAETVDASTENNEPRAGARTYIFGLPIVTPDGRSTLEFEVESEYALTKSPVLGYETVSRPKPGAETVTRLRRVAPATFKERVMRWLWGIGGMVAGIIISTIVSFCSGEEKTAPQTAAEQPTATAPASTVKQAEAPAATPKAKTETQTAAAIAYLDSNKVWRFDDMEAIPELQGLFDDLNNYRFERITEDWSVRLADSNNFKRVVDAARKAVARKTDPRYDPRRGPDHSPAYNRAGDTAISWLGYTYWIDP